MTPVAVGPDARDIWQEALALDPSAAVTQTPAWLRCVVADGRWVDATRAYRTEDGRPLILPLVRRHGLKGAAAMTASMPFGWSWGGLVTEAGALSADDVRSVATDLAQLGALRVSVRPTSAQDPTWDAVLPANTVRTLHTSQVLDLTGGWDEVWMHRFSGSVRRKARRAARDGVTVECDATGTLVPVFDDLYRRSVARWAEQQHEPLPLARWRAQRRDPERKFREVARRFGPDCRIWLARREGRPAAAIIVLSHGEHAMYWRGAMDKEVAAGTYANELLHQLAIADACRTGRRAYSMGESAPGSSLASFKHGFGARDVVSHTYRMERLPLTAADAAARRGVKRLLGFRD